MATVTKLKIPSEFPVLKIRHGEISLNGMVLETCERVDITVGPYNNTAHLVIDECLVDFEMPCEVTTRERIVIKPQRIAWRTRVPAFYRRHVPRIEIRSPIARKCA